MTRPRLLFVSPRFLFPPDCGGRIRTTQVLRGMKGGRFDITLASPVPAGATTRYRDEIDTVCDRFVSWPEPVRGRFFPLTRLRHLVSRLPVPVATDRCGEGQRVVAAELASGVDVVVVDFPHGAVLMPAVTDTTAVLFTHNVEAEIFARHVNVAANPVVRAVWRNQLTKMQRFEAETLKRFDAIVAVSQRDAEAFARDYAVPDARVIRTGVDLEFFTYTPPRRDHSVVFMGSMDWLANVDGIEFMIDEVWPAVRRRAPDATMTVIGRDPPEALVRRAPPGWRFTGFVDDVRPALQGAAAFVIPLRVGGGTRIKAFEAMAAGCPVVSTTIGIEGLPVTDTEHYLKADTADAFADAVVRIIQQPELGARLSIRARALVEAEFSFDRAAREFEDIVADALGDASTATVRPPTAARVPVSGDAVTGS